MRMKLDVREERFGDENWDDCVDYHVSTAMRYEDEAGDDCVDSDVSTTTQNSASSTWILNDNGFWIRAIRDI